MVSEENLEYLRDGARRHIVGTPKSHLKRYEQELLRADWQEIREGLGVKHYPSPNGKESFILCRSTARATKKKAIHDWFDKRIEKGLDKLVESCRKKKQKPGVIERRVGRLLGANSRTAGLFQVEAEERAEGGVEVEWKKVEEWRAWAELSEGSYMLRSNITDWDAEQLWRAYIQLTEAEAAFRIQKGDLGIRPIWHQTEERDEAHIPVCFLAYVFWKMLAQMCKRVGLGNEPRRVFDEITQIKAVDEVMPTRRGIVTRNRCIAQPTKPQAILLQMLGLHLPHRMKIQEL